MRNFCKGICSNESPKENSVRNQGKNFPQMTMKKKSEIKSKQEGIQTINSGSNISNRQTYGKSQSSKVKQDGQIKRNNLEILNFQINKYRQQCQELDYENKKHEKRIGQLEKDNWHWKNKSQKRDQEINDLKKRNEYLQQKIKNLPKFNLQIKKVFSQKFDPKEEPVLISNILRQSTLFPSEDAFIKYSNYQLIQKVVNESQYHANLIYRLGEGKKIIESTQNIKNVVLFFKVEEQTILGAYSQQPLNRSTPNNKLFLFIIHQNQFQRFQPLKQQNFVGFQDKYFLVFGNKDVKIPCDQYQSGIIRFYDKNSVFELKKAKLPKCLHEPFRILGCQVYNLQQK